MSAFNDHDQKGTFESQAVGSPSGNRRDVRAQSAQPAVRSGAAPGERSAASGVAAESAAAREGEGGVSGFVASAKNKVEDFFDSDIDGDGKVGETYRAADSTVGVTGEASRASGFGGGMVGGAADTQVAG